MLNTERNEISRAFLTKMQYILHYFQQAKPVERKIPKE